MEEAILRRGDGQMGLSCLFKALSSLLCCQLESVRSILTRWPLFFSKVNQGSFWVFLQRCEYWGSSDREVSMFFKLLIEAICVVLGRLRWPRWQDIFRYMHIYLRALSFLAVTWYCLVLQPNTTKQGHGTWRSWKMEILSTEEIQKSKIANQMSKSPPLESKLFKLRNAQQTLEWVLCIRDLQLRKQRMTTRNPEQHPSTHHPHQDYKSLSILAIEDWCWCFFFIWDLFVIWNFLLLTPRLRRAQTEIDVLCLMCLWSRSFFLDRSKRLYFWTWFIEYWCMLVLSG